MLIASSRPGNASAARINLVFAVHGSSSDAGLCSGVLVGLNAETFISQLGKGQIGGVQGGVDLDIAMRQ